MLVTSAILTSLAVQFSLVLPVVPAAETPCERLYSFCMQVLLCANAGAARMDTASKQQIKINRLQNFVLQLIFSSWEIRFEVWVESVGSRLSRKWRAAGRASTHIENSSVKVASDRARKHFSGSGVDRASQWPANLRRAGRSVNHAKVAIFDATLVVTEAFRERRTGQAQSKLFRGRRQ